MAVRRAAARRMARRGFSCQAFGLETGLEGLDTVADKLMLAPYS